MAGIHPLPENAGTGEPGRADYSCLFCKKRKVKCDRLIPSCSICQRTHQDCEYPLDAGKPGPKLGTTRKKRPRSESVKKQPDRRSTKERSNTTASVDREVANLDVTDSNMCPNHDAAVHDHDAAVESPNDKNPGSYPLTPATTPLDVRTLAYIMHPSHDNASISSPDEDFNGSIEDTVTSTDGGYGAGNAIAQACNLLGIPQHALQPYLNLYFDNMTAFSLFHQPTFGETLTKTISVNQLTALFASMFAFSARFRDDAEENASSSRENYLNHKLGHYLPPSHFEDLSRQMVDKALEEFPDGPPSLLVLQALVLLTFQQLIKGARGSAWRRLGVCIRVAYELDLHHVDRYNNPEQENPTVWTRIEERRRTWWAIWEMDVFASMIRRCPTGIDWADNETRLPVADEDWWQQRFVLSCFLESKPMERLKALQQCGTESPKAWFIVLDSLMRDGHTLSRYRSPRPGTRRPAVSLNMLRSPTKDNSETLATLNNILRCFCMALPKCLRLQGGFMNLSSGTSAASVASRQLLSARYSIQVTIQLTRMMLHHQDAYCGAKQDLCLTDSRYGQDQGRGAAVGNGCLSLHIGPMREGLQQFIEAADELLRIVSSSAEDHVRYVNPFLASTIWYGAVIHIGWKVLAPPSTNLDWIESKFVVMHMILGKFAEFWDLPRALQENLASVEEKLSFFTRARARRPSRGRKAVETFRSKPAMNSDRNGHSVASSADIESLQQPGGPTRPFTMPHSVERPNHSGVLPTDGHSVDLNVNGRASSAIINAMQVPNNEEAVFDQAFAPAIDSDGHTREEAANGGDFFFDSSCLMPIDLDVSTQASARENTYPDSGLWDDLQWDLGSSTDPGRLLMNIMDYA